MQAWIKILIVLLLIIAHSAMPQSIALTGMRVIDGVSDSVFTDWTILIDGESISAAGSDVLIPEATEVIDLTGKTVLPGFVDMHVHMWGYDIKQYEVYSKLMLAGGVTTVFSLGDIFPEDLQEFRKSVDEGEIPGPTIYTVGPYFNGGAANSRFRSVNTVDEALSLYSEWKDKIEGIKFYVQIGKDEFDTITAVAKSDGKIVTGHLMSINTEHAIDQGISGLEHGLWTIQELISKSDRPGQFAKIAAIDMQDPDLIRIIDKIVENDVYVDPTITPFEAFLGGPRFVHNWNIYLDEESRQSYNPPGYRSPEIIDTMMIKQRQFVKMVYNKGGLIVTGTDPFYPDTPPGFAMHREIIALTEAGLSNMDAIKAATRNGAIALKRDKEIGSISEGKFADLVVIAGRPDENIGEISNTVSVFKEGKQYSTYSLREQCIGGIDLIKDK